MSTSHSSKATKIRIFRFLQLTWTQILTGELSIDPVSKSIKIFYNNSTNDHLIPNCTPRVLEQNGQQQQSKQQIKCMEIGVQRLSKIEQEDTDKKLVYIWIDVNPFSISFLSEHKATQTCQLLQLIEENMEIAGNEQQSEETSLEYIKNLFEYNPSMLSTLFINNNMEVVDQVFKAISLTIKQELTQEQKQNYFIVVKTAIRVGDKKIIEKLIQDFYFQLLAVLSWNTFNKPAFDYTKQYDRLVNFNNILNIKNENLLKIYEQSARIKFLRDVAACAFIEVENERILQNMLVNNYKAMLVYFGEEGVMDELVDLSTKDPRSYLNIFTEMWEMFKSCYLEYENRHIKEEFVAKFIEKGLHNCAIKAANTILNSFQKSSQVNARFHQKWIQAFNPFLSYNWQFSQQWLISCKNESCLMSVLFKMFSECEDEGLMQAVLGFVRWLIEPSQNRLKVQCKLRSYVFGEFVSKIWVTMKKSTDLLEIFIDFVVKVYKADIVRTRRILIENKVLYELDNNIIKKPILICIIKLLELFLQAENLDIFIYLKNHLLFKGLKQQYLRNVNSKNMINSCFRSLLKKIKNTENGPALIYFDRILLENASVKCGDQTC